MPPSYLRSHETRALRSAVSFMTSGEADGVPPHEVVSAKSAFNKLCEAPPQAKWLPFSQKELELLWLEIENGAPETGNNLGMTAAERRTFFAAANRIADAGAIAGSRF